MDGKNTASIPVGLQFLNAVFDHQNACEQKSLQHLPQIPDGALPTLTKLGTALSYLDRLASCFWGCHGREHIIEKLVGRCVSSAIASLRLINFGHYDEALSLTRNIAEIGNLMFLFFEKPENIRKWIDSTEKERRNNFAPVKVRHALEALGTEAPTDSEKYGLLCEVSVHVNPDTSPQSFNTSEIPTLGGYYQERGHLTCINELAWAVATVGGPAAGLALIPRVRAKEVIDAVVTLAEAVGDILLSNKGAAASLIEVSDSSRELLERTRWFDKHIRKKT